MSGEDVSPKAPVIEIVGNCTAPLDLDIKRFYMPGVVLCTTCPKCGHEHEEDFGREYIGYPSANTAIDYVCYCGRCEHEWTVPLRLTVKLEVAVPADDTQYCAVKTCACGHLVHAGRQCGEWNDDNAGGNCSRCACEL